MQQHSYPSHSRHFVFPAPASPLTREEIVEEAAEPGPLRFTSWDVVEVHIFYFGRLQVWGLFGGLEARLRFGCDMLVWCIDRFRFEVVLELRCR